MRTLRVGRWLNKNNGLVIVWLIIDCQRFGAISGSVTARRPGAGHVIVNGHLLQRRQRRVKSKTSYRPPPQAIRRKVPGSNVSEYRCAYFPLWDSSKRNGNFERGTATSASEPQHVLTAIPR